MPPTGCSTSSSPICSPWTSRSPRATSTATSPLPESPPYHCGVTTSGTSRHIAGIGGHNAPPETPADLRQHRHLGSLKSAWLGLENCCGFRVTVGSNLTLSATNHGFRTRRGNRFQIAAPEAIGSTSGTHRLRPGESEPIASATGRVGRLPRARSGPPGFCSRPDVRHTLPPRSFDSCPSWPAGSRRSS